MEEPSRFPCVPHTEDRPRETTLLGQMHLSWSYIPETFPALEPLLEKQFQQVGMGTDSGPGQVALKVPLCCLCHVTSWPPAAASAIWGQQSFDLRDLQYGLGVNAHTAFEQFQAQSRLSVSFIIIITITISPFSAQQIGYYDLPDTSAPSVSLCFFGLSFF